MLESIGALIADVFAQRWFTGAEVDPARRMAQSQVYCLPTKDYRYVTLHLSTSDRFWTNLVGAIGTPEWAGEARFAKYADRVPLHAEIAARLAPVIQSEMLEHWEQRLIAADVPFAPVMSTGDLINHPQVKLLRMFEPVLDGIALQNPPWRFDGAKPIRATHAPAIGEHSVEVLREVIDDATIDRLREAGVIVQRSNTPPKPSIASSTPV
jgi:crotonobetainyl-CoA:carnitine CoA-transferase CaiB-like acyl-CoA transferase